MADKINTSHYLEIFKALYAHRSKLYCRDQWNLWYYTTQWKTGRDGINISKWEACVAYTRNKMLSSGINLWNSTFFYGNIWCDLFGIVAKVMVMCDPWKITGLTSFWWNSQCSFFHPSRWICIDEEKVLYFVLGDSCDALFSNMRISTLQIGGKHPPIFHGQWHSQWRCEADICFLVFAYSVS